MNKGIRTRIITKNKHQVYNAIKWAIDKDRKFHLSTWFDLSSGNYDFERTADGWSFEADITQDEMEMDFDVLMESILNYE